MPILLDPISTDLLMACDPDTGNDLLAHYKAEKIWQTLFRWNLLASTQASR